jgi:hypothetical protein
MKSAFIKPRALPGGRSFGEQAKRMQKAAQRGGGNFRVIEGQYNGFYPRKEKALWFAICPDQSWDFEIYDREVGEVVKLEGQLFYAYVSHRVASNGRSFQCSAGAHKNKPCWGCGVRNHFYEQKRIKEEATSVKVQGEAPINAMTQYAMAGVLLETIAKVPLLDNNGKARLTKKNEPILKEIPTALMPLPEAKRLKAEGSTTFGLSVHYSTGITHFNALTDFDTTLQNYCANCGDELYAVELACGECGTTQTLTDEDGEVVTLQGQTLLEARQTDLTCECGYHGVMVPIVQCTCDAPTEGKLVDFAVRLISRKIGEKQTVLEFTEVRPIKRFIEKHPHVAELLAKPLKLDEIFAPTRLESQTYMVPEALRPDGVSPAPRAKKDAEPAAESYPLGGDDEDDD